VNASSIITEFLQPSTFLELRMELLLLAAMIGFAVINQSCLWLRTDKFHPWCTGGNLKQISKGLLGRPDKHSDATHSVSYQKSSRGRDMGMEEKTVHCPRPCMIMDEIMEVGPLIFYGKKKEHTSTKWSKPAPQLKNGSQLNVDTQVVGETLTKAVADYILRLFDEFCDLLDRHGLTMEEIARITKHNALDFYDIMVQSCVKMIKNNKVAEILTHLAKHKIPRNVGFCQDVLKQLAAARWFKEGLRVYPILVSDGLEPSTVMCSLMIFFAAECRDHELAKHFYSQLCSLATPNLRTCMTMLQVHSKRRDWQAALEVYRGMQVRKDEIDGHVLNMVMGICAAAGVASEVERLLGEAETVYSELVLTDAVSYNTVIKAYAQSGNYPKAAEVLMRMRTRGLEPSAITYNSLIYAAARTGEAVAAWELYHKMVAHGFPGDKYSCSILVKTLSPRPTGDRIHKCLDLLLEVGTTCDMKLRTRVYHHILEAALQLRDSTVLIRSFSQTRMHRVRPTAAFCRRLKEFADQGNGPSQKALEAAVGDEGAAALGSELQEKWPAASERPSQFLQFNGVYVKSEV